MSPSCRTSNYIYFFYRAFYIEFSMTDGARIFVTHYYYFYDY